MEAAKDVAAGTVVGTGSVLFLQGLTSTALPTIMSYTGTVIAGVGTIQAPIVATLATFASTPLLIPAATVGGAAGLAYYMTQ